MIPTWDRRLAARLIDLWKGESIMHATTDKLKIQTWAKNLLNGDKFLILDTETTGLYDDAEIIQLAIIDREDNVLFDSYIKPLTPIIENGKAFEVNGITNEMVKDAPTFDLVWPFLADILVGEQVVIYNADFDFRMLSQGLHKHGIKQGLAFKAIDAMQPYSDWVGEWNERFGNNRWQRLPGGGHTALADCQAVLALLRKLADG